MRLPNWMSLPRKLPGLLLVAILVPVIALAWLGWRLVEQDRALETQRILEHLEDAADLIAASIDRRIAGIQDRLTEPAANFSSPVLQGDALIVRLSPGGLDVYPSNRLLFQPQIAAAPQARKVCLRRGNRANSEMGIMPRPPNLLHAAGS